MYVGEWDISEPHALEPQTPEPVLLVLTGEGGEPNAVGDLSEQRGEDGQKRIPEALGEKVGPQGIDSVAVGAAKAPDPEGLHEAFEVSLNKPMSPETGRSAGQAAFRPGPGIPFAEFH